VLSDRASGLLDSAVAAMGGTLGEWSVTQIDHRPGGSTTVAYRASVEWPEGRGTENFAARLSSNPLPANGDSGVLRMSDGDHEVQLWRLASDPALPALASVCDREAVADLLRAVGIAPTDVRVRIVGYRPCRRAVIEVTTPYDRLYVKVVRPRRAADLHRRLVLTRAAGLPTPRSLGWSDDGAVVLQALSGLGLRQALQQTGPQACRAAELTELLDRLPAELCELPPRAAWSESAAHYAEVIASVVPALGARAEVVAAEVAAGLEGGVGADSVHGDYYEAQLLAMDGRITGVLDFDNAGPGHRADDLACALAHLSVLVVMAPSASAGIRAALADWAQWFDRHVDPRQLRLRAAGVTLSLATGPFRVQDPVWPDAVRRRVALAEQWLTAARTLSLPDFERALMPASEPSHAARTG
jgi:aminoglycoside phosphotransferase